MRPAHVLVIILLCLAAADAALLLHAHQRRAGQEARAYILDVVTAGLGLTDLCVATEARYTRHPAVTDFAAPFMDHPGAIEHFPTGSFWAPARR